MAAQALDDLRVLELQGPLAQYCGKLLADLGADVIKVEPPGGDPARRIGPFHDGVAHRERSLQFFYFNTNKRSIALDLECDAGRVAFRKLARTADVILESFDPGTPLASPSAPRLRIRRQYRLRDGLRRDQRGAARQEPYKPQGFLLRKGPSILPGPWAVHAPGSGGSARDAPSSF